MIEKLYIGENTVYREADVNNALNELLSSDANGGAWLIHSEGKIAGYMIIGNAFSVEFGGKTAFIDELYIIDSYRGKGIGRKALEFAEV